MEQFKEAIISEVSNGFVIRTNDGRTFIYKHIEDALDLVHKFIDPDDMPVIK